MKISEMFANITQQTTIHGLRITGLPKLYIFERLFWIVIITLATIGSIAICYSNWMRFLATPTVTSLLKDYRNWENPFPAATACLINRIDPEKATKYIHNTWAIEPTDPKFDDYMNFIRAVTNVSWLNLENFAQFQHDNSLNLVDMEDLAIKVHPKIAGAPVTFDTKRPSNWAFVMTEMGVCFTLNSKFSYLFALNSSTNSKSVENKRVLRCHYLNGLCYARYDSDPTQPLKYYIHSYLDVLQASIEPPLVVNEGQQVEINYRMQETESSISLRTLRPSQRRCRFDDEPTTPDLPVYSLSICYIICRYRLAMKLCGCRPFFYHNFNGKPCDINGLVCLSRYSKNLTAPPSKLGCKCTEPCNVVTYFTQVPKITNWEYGYFETRISFRWGLLAPTTKFHRDVLFGFEDLVVSFGGTLALFLGVSFITAIETIFLIVENLYLYCKDLKRTTITTVEPSN